jgi:hypothetical protein
MQLPHILVLEREPLIADDMREEVLALAQDAVVEHATTFDAADDLAGRMPRIDLLIVSSRSESFIDARGYESLARQARSVLLIGPADEGAPSRGTGREHVARTPFTSASLREDLQGISVDGAPLFPQKSPEPQR